MAPKKAIKAIRSTTGDVQAAPPPGPNQVLIHYRRRGEDYAGWGLHVWGPVEEEANWETPLKPAGRDQYGLYWLVDLLPNAKTLNYIIHSGEIKDLDADQTLNLSEAGREIWLVEGIGTQYQDPKVAKEALLIRAVGDIKNSAQAHWICRDIIAWHLNYGPQASYELHIDPAGALELTHTGVVGGQRVSLEFLDWGLRPSLAARFPHLQNTVMLRIPDSAQNAIAEFLRGQTVVSVSGPDGKILGATGLQIPGVLDDLFAYSGPLGVSYINGRPHFRLWAPTARAVELLLFPDSAPETRPSRHAMHYDPETGVWVLVGEPAWDRRFYLYEVEVFVRQEGSICHNQVTDPYSLSLSLNSHRSQIVDLSDPSLVPPGWDELQKPTLDEFTDIVLYELHIRDFSAFEPGVPDEWRGGYLAFTAQNSTGVAHLRRLAQAGVTHVHLLPAADIATIDENKAVWARPDYEQLSQLPGHSPAQQAALAAFRGRDGYNWGYDPYHYLVPEGSYATEPDGPARILEFRQMVQALNEVGLRVVMDVVYNHTYAAGQSEKSVLDKIVPGYYYRLDHHGHILNSTCCMNTATEHAMMEKLVIDSLLIWAECYKIDAFRFDLMGQHMVENISRARAALDELNLAQNGVDGRAIYLYGEGWDFGELAHNARGANANQRNMAGTGVGTFNDRIRDAVRGGGPFGNIRQQGFLTGLFTDPNTSERRPRDVQRAALLESMDWIRLSMAGNLADYPLTTAEGITLPGAEIQYNGQPAGYTRQPVENVLYISAHDNETLFDAIQYKAAEGADLAQRLRMQNLGISIVALGQGVPFFAAGIELLRSKSLDRDSYDSGDWFNRLDYTCQTNNWAVGLPPQDKNGANWALMERLLADRSLKPDPEMIRATRAHFEEMLQIRKSTLLLRLRSAEDILQRVRFLNTGPDQFPGLLVMQIEDGTPEVIDPALDRLIVMLNANPGVVSFPVGPVARPYTLHLRQQESADPLVRSAAFDPSTSVFRIPGRTAAVFVQRSAG